MYADELLLPWHRQVVAQLPPDAALFDAHTHFGHHDPDGFRCTPEELLAALEPVGSPAVVFPMHEPDGYEAANDETLRVAAASEGRLVPFCRVDPHRGGFAELRRCVAAGARGLKLHPRAEGFGMADAEVRELVAVAHEERLPILIHAGRGIPALGEKAVELAAEFPDARLILAHAGISDLAWIWRPAAEHPNLLFDTSWMSAPDVLALFALVPPGQILYGSDIPFGAPVQSSILTFRCALQAGLDADQLRGVAGEQVRRLLAREELLELGPAPGGGRVGADPLIGRLTFFLGGAIAAGMGGGSDVEFLELALTACEVPDSAPQSAVCGSVAELLELARASPTGTRLQDRFRRMHLLVTAATVAATPDVPVAA